MAPDDKARREILARRARFVAAALTSMGIAAGVEACKSSPPPEPCLSIAPEHPPEACLSVEPEPVEDAGPPPQVCLSPMQPVEPDPEPGPFSEPPPDDRGGT
jgi:hypothetical protein